ncbi:AraC family transcriptional regulator [Candidatus Pantoea persica]|uniref:AraC family transcriptional regulator n=1 Tax=Candidatus Pantoea persica TaxID=2518128 RepID=UPI00403DDF93|nr:AraC family transcriptional regulator [Candidatus Pantoea persica]
MRQTMAVTTAGSIFSLFGHNSRPSEPIYHAQWASFALVAKGGKALRIGEDVIHYGLGDLLLVTMDMPVRSCVTVATPEKPNLGIAINESRLMRFLEQFPPGAALAEARNERGIAAHKVSPLLVDAVIRLIRLLDQPQDIAALAPLIEQEIFYRLLTGPGGGRILNMALAERLGNKVAQAAREFLSSVEGRPAGQPRRHEHLFAASSLQGRDGDDADAVSETAASQQSASPDDGGKAGCRNGGLSRGISERVAVQPRIAVTSASRPRATCASWR